jgi:hypothetical protein
MLAYPGLPWQWHVVGQNPNIRMADLLGPLAPLCPIEKMMDGISRNTSLTLADVAANLDQPWDRYCLSCNMFGWSNDSVATQRRQAKRTAVYKRELMERAWHPDRFLTWCVETDGKDV